MNSTAPDNRQPPGRRGRYRFVLTTVLAAVGLLVAILAWRFPVGSDPDGSPDRRGQASAGVAGAPTTPGATSLSRSAGPAAQVRYLNTITPEEGGRYLARLPADLAGRSEYAHAVTFTCPSNQSSDRKRVLTYPLNQRYVVFTGTVTARFQPTVSVPDPQVEVVAIANERQRDGTLNATGTESRRATAALPSPISLSVDGAEKLTLQVSCKVPDGVVILTGAQLTLAQ